MIPIWRRISVGSSTKWTFQVCLTDRRTSSMTKTAWRCQVCSGSKKQRNGALSQRIHPTFKTDWTGSIRLAEVVTLLTLSLKRRTNATCYGAPHLLKDYSEANQWRKTLQNKKSLLKRAKYSRALSTIPKTQEVSTTPRSHRQRHLEGMLQS